MPDWTLPPKVSYNKDVRIVPKVVYVLLLALVLAASAPARPTVSATATWKGWDDKVGGWWNGGPDGLRDAHVAIQVSAPGETLTAIAMYPLDPEGKQLGPRGWDTTPLDGKWILGVVRAGTRLNPTKVRLCDPLGSAPVTTYDLYGEADGTTVPGRALRIDLVFASGAKATATTVVGPLPAGSLPAATIALPKPSVPQPTGTEQCGATDGTGGGSLGTSPGSGLPGKLVTSLSRDASVTRRSVRAGTCTTVFAAYGAALPVNATVSLERRRAGQRGWSLVKRGGAATSARVCAQKRGAASFRSTLRQGAKVLVTSNLVTVTWK